MKKYLIYSLVLAMAIVSCSKDKDKDEDSGNNHGGGTAPIELTITSNDFGSIGDIIYRSLDSTDIANNSIDAVNGIWDYKNLSEDKPDTINFKDPNGLPGSSNFPDANLAIINNINYMYAIKTNNQIDIIGICTLTKGQKMVIPFDDYLTMYKFPLKEGSSFSDEGSGETTITQQGITIIIKLTLKINAEVLSKGEMKLAADSATCIKEKRTMISHMYAYMVNPINHDTAAISNKIDTLIAYDFYAKGKGFTYVEVALDSLGNNKSITFLK